ncbi:MAG TPA: FMN-binding protein [Cellvibrionaceae bacterium]
MSLINAYWFDEAQTRCVTMPVGSPTISVFMLFNRRQFNQSVLITSAWLLLPVRKANAKTYLTIEQAQQAIWGSASLTPAPVELTGEQQKAIEQASKVKVRNGKINAWKTADKGWFIVDQVIGKHENIDMAVGITAEGAINGVEILTYRETYGFEIQNAKWRQQFNGKNVTTPLRLDGTITNISGATLSCAHVTDGIKRLTHTWNLVLKTL